ncbi:MAG: NTP transferase domain-containing protein [Thermoplasmata archaeon]|nr:NTP transferase domain-containing protein [Thermoplasmata archaeon]
MKAVILTAGEGTRLRPLTLSRAKGMIPIANRPILEYVIQALADNGIRDIIMVVGYKKERIMTYFEDGKKFKVKIKYVEQRKQLGTAHALKQAEKYIDSRFLVLPGDNIIESEGISTLLKPTKKKWDASILITECETPSKYGVVGMDGKRVKTIVEKPMISGDFEHTGMPSILSFALWQHQEKSLSNYISTGICNFPPEVFKIIDVVANEEKYGLTDVVLEMIAKGNNIRGVMTDTWADAVYPWDLLNMNAVALGHAKSLKSGKLESNVMIKPPVEIGEDTTIHANSYIVGPVIIGKGCEIGPNACIYPSTSIGDNVTIEPFTELKNDVIMNDVRIGSSSMISHSVIGSGTNLGSNFVAESSVEEVQLKDTLQELRHIGTIIGENCVIGHNVVALPGTVIGANCKVASLKALKENIRDNSIVV